MPECSACDGVKWNLAQENVFHSSALKVYLHKYVRVCEIEAVVKSAEELESQGRGLLEVFASCYLLKTLKIHEECTTID